jgi:hypothetical protein
MSILVVLTAMQYFALCYQTGGLERVKLGLVAAAALSIAFISPAFSQQAPTCEGSKDACQQISDLSKEYDAAFNKHDVATVVGMFTPDAADRRGRDA